MIARGKNWRDFGASDKKLAPALNQIARLKAARLTIEMVGADFLHATVEEAEVHLGVPECCRHHAAISRAG